MCANTVQFQVAHQHRNSSKLQSLVSESRRGKLGGDSFCKETENLESK